jgi:GMP synthase (glutamine-hydrolysing)
MNKPVCFIQTGQPNPALRETHGDYSKWFSKKAILDEDEFHVFRVYDSDCAPTAEQIELNYSAVIVSGSPFMVTDKADWSVRTGELLKTLTERGNIHILAVCYGHQLLADALGGSVMDNPKGPTYGSVKLTLDQKVCDSDPLMSAIPNIGDVYVFVSHRQSVLKVPEATEVLACSPTDLNHVIRFGRKCWGIQFHPEYREEISRGLLKLRREVIVERVGQALYDSYLESIRSSDIGTILLQRFLYLATTDRSRVLTEDGTLQRKKAKQIESAAEQ